MVETLALKVSVKLEPRQIVTTVRLDRHLDGDEVCLALIGDGFGQKGLPATRGAVEQNPLRGGHPKLEKLLRVLHRVLRGCINEVITV